MAAVHRATKSQTGLKRLSMFHQNWGKGTAMSRNSWRRCSPLHSEDISIVPSNAQVLVWAGISACEEDK